MVYLLNNRRMRFMSISGISNAYTNLSSGYKITAPPTTHQDYLSEKLTAAATGYEVNSSNAIKMVSESRSKYLSLYPDFHFLFFYSFNF